MNAEIITEDDLMAATKYQKRSYLVKWLDEERIPYKFVGHNRRIITTRSALNHALMGSSLVDREAIELL